MAVWWWALPMFLLACHSFRTHTFAPPAMLIEETGPQMLVFVLEHGLSFQHPCAAARRDQRPIEGSAQGLLAHGVRPHVAHRARPRALGSGR